MTFTVQDGGTTIGVAAISATVSAGAASVSYSLPAATTAKSYTIQAVYNPAGSPNFLASSDNTHTLSVGTSTPSVTTWPTASAIAYGQTLASSTLTGGSALVSGSFAFTTPSTAPGVGTAAQSVTFTPTDMTDYTTAAGTASVTVNKADQSTLTVTGVPTSAQAYGATFTVGTSGGSGTGAVTFSGSGACSASSTTVTMTSGSGTCSVTAAKAGDTNYNSATSAAVTVSAVTAPVSGTTPVINGLNPALTTAGSAGFTLTVTGVNFESGVSVLWNGSALTTTFVSSTQLTAAVPAASIASAGIVDVKAANSGA